MIIICYRFLTYPAFYAILSCSENETGEPIEPNLTTHNAIVTPKVGESQRGDNRSTYILMRLSPLG